MNLDISVNLLKDADGTATSDRAAIRSEFSAADTTLQSNIDTVSSDVASLVAHDLVIDASITKLYLNTYPVL